MNEAREHPAGTGILLGGFLIGAGGVLLGLQVDQNGAWSGTGWTAFAIGALLALGAMLLRARREGALPRDTLGITAVVNVFAGLTFVLSGVLAPGGPWMFFEIAVLVAIVVFKRPQESAGRWLSYGMLGLLAALLFFKCWVAYQGSENRWSIMSLDIPVISALPFDFLDPIKRIALGSFTPHEMGFPPAGLSFAPTLALWSIGFALCVAGLLLTQASAREHENDRIHALIHTLPGGLANFVERIVPEEEWCALGLHGLPERRLARRIESLVAERMARQKELQSALDAGRLLAQTNPGGFAGGIYRAIVDPDAKGTNE